MSKNISNLDQNNKTGLHKIYPNTLLGKNTFIGEYVILGVPPKKPTSPLVIGKNATIRSHTVIYAGNAIGKNFTTGHGVFIQENNHLGDKVSLGTKSVVLRDCRIGNNVRIHTQVFIPEYTIIQDDVWIGPNTVITNTPHPTCAYAKECMKKAFVKIESNVKVGANATILPGVTIGRGALIGAGSVVPKDVPPNSVVIGNPAKVIKNINKLVCQYDLTDQPY